ncbi:MAG: ATP-binding cassette domain-containing protein [Oscillospiraceae bacterium]|nr:ATP-binding cassette domain-containing protein [Oscillospiraceae bacterium]
MELTIRELTKSYGEKLALDGFTYTFHPGVTAILGPNGAGKTTLMNLITDCVKRQTGEILYDSTDILKLGKTFRQKLGFMPQSQGMYEQMTAFDFLCYVAELKGMKKRAALSQIQELLMLVNLEDAAHRKVGGFSGGMRQRVMLAQAMLGSPEVLLLDEPTAGLDPEERIRLRGYIGQLAQKRIVLITTHITGDVETIADEILLMNNGRLLFASGCEAFVHGCGAKDLEDAYIKRLHAS